MPFHYAVRNLGRGRARLVMSVLGAALVVALVLTAGGFVRGLDQSIRSTGDADNVILLGAGSEESVERSEVEPSAAGAIADAIPGIRERAGVRFLSPEVHVMLPVAAAGPDEPPPPADSLSPPRQLMLRGVTPPATLVHRAVTLVEGRWPHESADELVLGLSAATALGLPDQQVAVGRRLRIDGRGFTIVGHFAAPGTAIDAEAWMPLSDLLLLTRRGTLSCVVITLDPYDQQTGTGAELADAEAFAASRPDLELVAISERAYYARLAEFYGPLRIVVWFTAGLIALGGLLGGLNSTYAAFAARSRELGTLQALGFRRRALALSMVQESTLAAAAGGLAACAGGIFLLDGVAVRLSMGVFSLVIDDAIIALGLLAALGLGVLGVLPPAVRCLRPPIPEALKAV